MRGLYKAFGGQPVYAGFGLDLRRGDVLCVFGPNGCGKSTLINMIARLLPADRGDMLFNGHTVKQIRVGYVFENYREALFPWKTAAENLRYPLRRMRLPRAEMERWVERLCAQFRVRFDLASVRRPRTAVARHQASQGIVSRGYAAPSRQSPPLSRPTA